MKLKVLILEDRPTDAELMLRELRRAGYAPECQRVETEADYLAQIDQGWEIILADYNLPRFTGLQALELLKAHGLDIPFILISGTIGEDKAVAAMKAGASDYVMKDKLARLGPAVERGLREAVLRQEKKRTEAMLRESEQKYRGIFESSFDAITWTEPPLWKFTSANPAAVKMFGAKDEDELISHGPWEVSPERQPDGRASDEKAKEVIEIAMREGHHFFEWTHRRIGGKEFPAEVVLSRMEQNGQTILQGTIRDISERKRAEQALHKREADLELAQQIGHLGSWESDLASGALVWSKESYRIFGCDPAAFVPTREGFFQLVHPDDRARVREAVEQAISRGTDYEVEHRIQRPDGTERVVAEKGRRLRNAQGKAERLVGTTQDITERRRAEQTLHDSQELYSSLVQNLPQNVFRKDREGRFLFVNQRFCEGVGRSLQDIVGQTDADLFPPQLAAAYRQDDLHVMESGQVLDRVEEHVNAGGQKMFVQVVKTPLFSASRAVIGVQGIFWDITERMRAEQSIRKQAALLDAATDAIYVRALDHTIRYWNQGAERLYGWTRAEAMGRKITELGNVDPAAFESAHAALLQQGHWAGELKKTNKAGRQMVIFCRLTLLRDEHGRPEEVLVINSDLTEQKKLEAQFLRAQRMEAVGTLAGGIAHDLNNILAPILMGAPLLRGGLTPAEMAPTLNAIESSAQRGADVVRQLMAFSRGQSGQRSPLHLKHLLRDLHHIIRETFPKNIHFTLSEAPDLWPLVADPTQLHQILLNLCINARDAMPEGGTLAVTTFNFQADDHYAGMVPDARPGPYVFLKVSDTGSGIRPENLDKLFDPFFTTKEQGRGTGLGLATVHRVVTGHGGFIRVHSQVGKGTTFGVYLPASPEAVAPAVSASPPSLLAGHGELILVVDDEANIRQITEETLLRHGYRALTASDGLDAITVFAQYKAEIKAVLTDLMMPNLDGLGLVKVLAQMKPGLPVVLSTGVGDDPERHQTFAAMGHLGVSIMLTKPYTADELLNALHALLPAK